MPLSQTLPGTQDTSLVTFTIQVNGSDINPRFQVASLLVTREINRIPAARLIIFDGDAAAQDFPISDQPDLVPGSTIDISVGYNSDETALFSGIVLKHSLKIRTGQSPLLILECRDETVKMTVARKSKYFYNASDSDAVSRILGDYQLDTSGIDDTQVQHEAIVQYDCTDWDFIISRMEANGFLCTVDAGKLTAQKPDFTASTVLDAVFGSTILEFDADLDARNQYQGLKANSWDYSNQDVTSVDAQEPNYSGNGNLSASDLGNVLDIAEYDLNPGEDLKEDELQSWADARLMKARLSRCRGRVRFRGYGSVNPGDMINIGGVGDRFNGAVFVSGVRQEVASGNWTTDVQFGLTNEPFTRQPDVSSPSAADMLPAVQGLQIGKVTDLENDPDSEDRIRVSLPIIDADEDGVWSRVACLDAGDNRGTFFRPEVGDEVLVGFLNNDPRNPIVLGQLNSSAKPAPLKASNDNDEKGYVSRSGMTLIFNDSENSVKITTPAGKKVTLSEQDGVITIEDENSNKISMDDSSITVQSSGDINLTANGNLNVQADQISLTANSSFSLDAGGASISAGDGSVSVSAPTVSISGSGTTNITGGMVMINS
jgi:Rhs element Vgr protein